MIPAASLPLPAAAGNRLGSAAGQRPALPVGIYRWRLCYPFTPRQGAVPMPSLSPRRPLVLLALIVVMAAIFLIDTVTDYAVAAACFYAAVILAASRVLARAG
jgi:hypothetical protein